MWNNRFYPGQIHLASVSVCLICLVGYNLDGSGTESIYELKTEHQPETEDLRLTTEIPRATLCEALKYTLAIGSLSAEKAGIKLPKKTFSKTLSRPRNTWYHSLRFERRWNRRRLGLCFVEKSGFNYKKDTFTWTLCQSPKYIIDGCSFWRTL